MSIQWRTSTLVIVAIIIWGIGLLPVVLVFSSIAFVKSSPASNSVEITIAIATVGSTLANVVLTVAAVLALQSLGESRRDRHLTAMTDMSLRWDNEHFRSVRQIIHNDTGSQADSRNRLQDAIIYYRDTNHENYRKFLTEPSFLEDLAISIKHGGIHFGIVKDSLGYIIWDRWCLWSPTVAALRDLRREPTVFEHFEALAQRIKSELPTLPAYDDWTGPKF